MAVKSISLASTYRGSASSSKSSISTVKSTSTQSSSSVAKTTTSKPMPSTVRPASTHSSTNAARAASSAVKPATNKMTPSTAKPASTNSATNAVKAASSAVKAVANKIAPNTVKLASTHSATNAVKAASSTVKPVANKIVPSTAKPASTHNTTTTVKSASSQSASNAAKATGNSIYQNSGNSLTSYPMSTNDAPSKTKVTSSKSTPSTVKTTSSKSTPHTAKTTSSKSTPSATKTSSNSANMPKPMHTHDSVSVTKAKGNSIYQNSGNSLTSYPMSTNDAPSKTKVTSSVNAKAQNTKLQQVVKGVKVTSNQVNKAYHAIDAMKPAKITKDMPLKEQFTTGLKNGGLVLVQKEKGKVDALVDTAVGTVKDTWELASNPKASWNKFTTAIANPKETAKAMGKAVQETVEKDYVQGNAYSRSYVEGKVKLGVGTALVGTKGLGSLTKIGKVPELDKGTVWGNIKITQPVYDGTKIPKSFELAVDGEKFWVHPNGTKHMVEYITRDATTHGMPINSQTLLTSFESSVKKAVNEGVKYEEIMNVGNWELIFSKPRGDGLLPVIKHAVYRP